MKVIHTPDPSGDDDYQKPRRTIRYNIAEDLWDELAETWVRAKTRAKKSRRASKCEVLRCKSYCKAAEDFLAKTRAKMASTDLSWR